MVTSLFSLEEKICLFWYIWHHGQKRTISCDIAGVLSVFLNSPLPRGGGGVCPPGGLPSWGESALPVGQTPPIVDRMTDACENIIFPHAVGKNPHVARTCMLHYVDMYGMMRRGINARQTRGQKRVHCVLFGWIRFNLFCLFFCLSTGIISFCTIFVQWDNSLECFSIKFNGHFRAAMSFDSQN